MFMDAPLAQSIPPTTTSFGPNLGFERDSAMNQPFGAAQLDFEHDTVMHSPASNNSSGSGSDSESPSSLATHTYFQTNEDDRGSLSPASSSISFEGVRLIDSNNDQPPAFPMDVQIKEEGVSHSRGSSASSGCFADDTKRSAIPDLPATFDNNTINTVSHAPKRGKKRKKMDLKKMLLPKEGPQDLSSVPKKERNKASAAKYRKRRKIYLERLENKVEELSDECNDYKDKVRELEAQNKTYKAQLNLLENILKAKGILPNMAKAAGSMMFVLFAFFLLASPADVSPNGISNEFALPRRQGRTLLSVPQICEEYAKSNAVEIVEKQRWTWPSTDSKVQSSFPPNETELAFGQPSSSATPMVVDAVDALDFTKNTTATHSSGQETPREWTLTMS